MAWLYLFIASLFEILWAIGLKYSRNLFEWSFTVLFIVGSFLFLLLAARKMKPSYAYVFFVVLGTLGTFVFDIYIIENPVNFV
ncbi:MULTISPECIES: DMT family transporter [Acinetobacter]|uniref:DMT family transporter n=1 Tax=Acinetobacter TaxID=469 RepID=UPI0005C4AE33|nr:MULTISPECIES: SMR family transporter [Acinetobacter]